MPFWIAQPPTVEGQLGTGPVDLAVATQVLSAPEGFDLPGGAGEIFYSAYEWFIDAAAKATTDSARHENYLGAFRAANNLGVYCMIKITDDPNSPQQAYDFLLEAERIATGKLPGRDLLHGGVLFNLGSLMEMAGRREESAEYRHSARALGFSIGPSD